METFLISVFEPYESWPVCVVLARDEYAALQRFMVARGLDWYGYTFDVERGDRIEDNAEDGHGYHAMRMEVLQEL